MTVKEIWDVSTDNILLFYENEPERVIKLPSGGRLQICHAEMIVTHISAHKPASEAAYLLVGAKEAEA